MIFFFLFLEIDSKEDQEEDEGIDEGEVDEEGDDDAQQEEFDDTDILEEIDDTNDDADGENNIPDNFDMEFDASTEIADNSLEDKDNDASEEFAGIPGVNEIDDNSAEPLEEVRFVTFIIFVHLYRACK